MPDGFNWAVGIGDAGASENVAKIAKSLEGLEKELKEVGTHTKETSEGLHSFGMKALELNQVLEVGKKIGEAFKEVGEIVFDMGKEFVKSTFEAAEFGESAEIAFKTLLGSAEASKQLMDDIVKTASRLPITTQQSVGYATSLITAGFKPDEMKTLLTAISDIGALNPGKQDEARDMLVGELRRIKGEGFLDERVLRSLGSIGVSSPKLFEQLGKQLGVGNNSDQIRKLIGERKVDSDQAVYAILQTLAKTEGGHLGNLSNELADTITGLFSTVKSRFFEAAKDLAEGPGFKAMQGFLKNVVALTDSTTESGKRMKGAIGDTFNAIMTTIFGGGAGQDGKTNLEIIFGKILDFAQGIPATISAAGNVIKSFFGGLFGDIDTLDTDWSKAFSAESINGLAPTFHDVGESIRNIAKIIGDLVVTMTPLINIVAAVTGFVTRHGESVGGAAAGAKIGSVIPGVGTAGGALVGGAIGGYVETKEASYDQARAQGLDYDQAIRASEHGMKFADGGVVTGEVNNATIGEGGETEVVAPLSRLQEFMDGQGSGGSGGGSGGNHNFTLNVRVDVGGGSAQASNPEHLDLAQEILQRVKEELPSTLQSMFEQLLLEGAA